MFRHTVYIPLDSKIIKLKKTKITARIRRTRPDGESSTENSRHSTGCRELRYYIALVPSSAALVFGSTTSVLDFRRATQKSFLFFILSI